MSPTSRCLALGTCLAMAIVAPSARGSAQATLDATLGGPVGFGGGVLAGNDDGFVGPIDLSAAFPLGLNFFGATHTTIFVNNNGNVTFNAGVGAYTPTPFPVAAQPMIAAWWGDVDTRVALAGGQNLVYYDVRAGRFTATYYNVGYYDSHTVPLNAFQIILTDASAVGAAGDFDVEFRYNMCNWLYGDVSALTPAQAGFDAGDGTNYFELPGSRTAAILTYCTTSNVGDPGVWRFQIHSGRVGVCGNTVREMGEGCDDGNTSPGDGCSARCSIELPPGSPCTDDSDCRSGFCTDGVCCDVRCDGQCEACNLAASVGSCAPAVGVPVGARPACTAPGTTCGGACDGALRTACTYPSGATACDDGAFCTDGDACSGAGACISGAPRSCDDGVTCTADACDESADTCTSVLAGGCSIGGACVADGALDPTNACMACQPGVSTSAYTPLSVGASCDDGLFCTDVDACDGAGTCSGAARSCDDGVSCTTDVCDEATDACSSFVGATCIIAGVCFADGLRDPANPCMACQAAIDDTAYTPLAAGETCDDGVFCTETDTCDGAGACEPGGPRDCDDGLSCTDDACDEAGDACDNTLTTGCQIGGACVADGAASASDACLVCDSTVDTDAYTRLAGCGDGGVPDAATPDAATPDAGARDATVGFDAQPGWEVRGNGACNAVVGRARSGWLSLAALGLAACLARLGGRRRRGGR